MLFVMLVYLTLQRAESVRQRLTSEMAGSVAKGMAVNFTACLRCYSSNRQKKGPPTA